MILMRECYIAIVLPVLVLSPWISRRRRVAHKEVSRSEEASSVANAPSPVGTRHVVLCTHTHDILLSDVLSRSFYPELKRYGGYLSPSNTCCRPPLCSCRSEQTKARANLAFLFYIPVPVGRRCLSSVHANSKSITALWDGKPLLTTPTFKLISLEPTTVHL